jgi:hypothetical protein
MCTDCYLKKQKFGWLQGDIFSVNTLIFLVWTLDSLMCSILGPEPSYLYCVHKAEYLAHLIHVNFSRTILHAEISGFIYVQKKFISGLNRFLTEVRRVIE